MAEGNANNDTTMFMVIILIAGGGWLFWYLFHEQVIYALRWIRYGEMWFLGRIVDNDNMRKFQAFFADSRSTVTWPHIAASSLIVGQYLRWPAAGILALCAFWIMFRSPRVSFRHAYGLDALIAAQSKVWPIISPIVNFNPAEDNSRDPNGPLPDKLPIFAEALSPDEWMKFYRVPRSLEGVDRDAATAAFATQLGPRWRGIRAMPVSVRALFAVCALKIARKREAADDLLGRLAQAVDTRNGMRFKPDLALRREIDQIIRDPALGGAAEQVAARHAFATPAMVHVLAHARDRGGVMAPAQFLWLRGVNRALWYPLDNLGRAAFHVEAAGAMAHYQAELAANRPLLTPKVATAVDALQKYSHENPLAPTLQLTG